MFCGFGLLHTEADSLHQFGEVFFYYWTVSLSVNRRQPALIGSPSFGISPTDNLTNDSKTSDPNPTWSLSTVPATPPHFSFLGKFSCEGCSPSGSRPSPGVVGPAC